MKHTILSSLFILALCFNANAQETKNINPAVQGTIYGNKSAKAQMVTAAQFNKTVTNDKPVAMQVKGRVVNVCENKGCWMNVDLENGEQIFVKMKDYGFFVPKDIRGKEVLLTGEAYKQMMSVKELKHFAEDAKKPQSEIDAITQPEMRSRFTAASIKVLD
ncbi:DUF4920 domain-containing protein [Haoranjiania flava]|uniref:DUF4920 domain-containing protein n=1 Tax=Haoranjiania flava TaxID=1856322 RepID=A0AAE3IM38_9BACT|nr:DUF4920 domain-containing protein [Haoranjiania flava]MCU7693530.1 DUF4920 domain-containing protein [Haoranjiania flava]